MARTKVVALINCPQYGLSAGQEGEIDIDPKDLEGRVSLGHLALVDGKKAAVPAPNPAS